MTIRRQCPKCQAQNVYYRHASRSWVCRKHGPILREGSETSADPPAPFGEEENKAARVRVEEKPTHGDTNVHDDVAAAIRALAAEEIGGSAGLGRIGAALQSSPGTWDEKVVKVQVFDFDRPQAGEIFAFFSSSRHPPAFVYNEQEKCLETELELICDEETGKYWCGGDIYYLEDAQKEIWLGMGEVKIIMPEGIGYRDLIVRDGRSRHPRW